MHIEAHRETIKACRFCFMCRHLSPVANVTFREADTPRGRALWLDRVLAEPRLLAAPDFAQTLYDADLSAACRRNCVNHFDEVGLVLAARRDLIEAGQVPTAVATLRTELANSPVIVRGETSAEVIVYEDAAAATHTPEIGTALVRLLSAAGVRHGIVAAADTGKALRVLGDEKLARVQAARVAEAIRGAAVRLVVTSCPAAYDAFRRDYAELGVPLGGDIEVLHSSDFILRLIERGSLGARLAAAREVRVIESDFLGSYGNGHDGVARLLDRLGVRRVPFGTNREESYAAGEGAIVLDRLNPALVRKLGCYVVARAESQPEEPILTASPYTKRVLREAGGGALRLTTVEELTASALG